MEERKPMLGRANYADVPRWKVWPPQRALLRERAPAEFYERPEPVTPELLEPATVIGSDIDPQYPVFGNPLTATVRENFQIDKDEIEELQRRVNDLEAAAWPTEIDG